MMSLFPASLMHVSLFFIASALAAQANPDQASIAAKSRGPLAEVKVEIRSDGLAYLPGATQPFTGNAIDLHFDRTPPRIAKQTPYVAGKKHGTVTTYTSGRKLREERTYNDGKAVSSIVYHGNGQKKLEVGLNEKDLAEGPYKLWHDNGVLRAEAVFDADERFHGEEKNYDREGKLIGHYRKDHGTLTGIIFETAEMKQERLEKMGLVPASSATPKPGELPIPALPK